MKRALVLTGGGAKGAFTIGALDYLFSKGYKFDIISGTSTGSLIAVMACVNGGIDILKDIYTSVDSNDILQQSDIIHNLTTSGKPYIYSTFPLDKLIREKFKALPGLFDEIMNSESILCLSAISLQTGLITVFTNKDIDPHKSIAYNTHKVADQEELILAMLASSSQAGFLPPVKIGNEQFVDGGNRQVIPTRIVYDLKPDHSIVVSNNPMNLFENYSIYDKLLPIVLRAIQIFIQDVRENNLALLEGKYSIIQPNKDLDTKNPTGLRFNKEAMNRWMADGYGFAQEQFPPNLPASLANI